MGSNESLIRIPDTKLVQEARELLEAHASPALVNHSFRTYLLGSAYARKKRLEFDDEGLAAAAMLHDIGLCERFRDPRWPFQSAGSRELGRLMTENGADASRVAPLVDAIDFHMQLFPRWSKGNVAGLLQIGAWMDITGLRRWAVWSDAKEISSAYPRVGIDTSFMAAVLRSIGSVRACVGMMFPPKDKRL